MPPAAGTPAPPWAGAFLTRGCVELEGGPEPSVPTDTPGIHQCALVQPHGGLHHCPAPRGLPLQPLLGLGLSDWAHPRPWLQLAADFSTTATRLATLPSDSPTEDTGVGG